MEQPQSQSPQYWLSLEQWQNDPEFQKFVEGEFHSSPLKSDDGQGGWARREFLKLMGASLALGSFGCVRRPAQKIVPYAKAPAEITPGIANYYSSSYIDALEGFSTVVTTREGRPFKVEGCPDSPTNGHGLSARAQAHVLSLWDPDRLSEPKHNLLNESKNNRDTISATWDKADADIVAALKEGKVAILTGAVRSPSTRALLDDFKSAYGADWFQWEATGLEGSIEGAKAAFGQAALVSPQLEKAQYIVTIDCDFLGTYLAPTAFARRFAQARKPGDNMAKLVAFESLVSLTGLNADERHRIRPSQQVDLAVALLHQIVVVNGHSRLASDASVVASLKKYTEGLPAPAQNDVIAKVAGGLWANRGKGAVLAGGMTTLTEASRELQLVVHALNYALENDGAVLDSKTYSVAGRMTSSQGLAQLAQGLEQGRYKTVIIYKTNPVYSAPAALNLTAALKKAKLLVYVDDRNDETGRISDYVLACSHPMECWGDAEISTGVFCIQQPTLRPLNNTRSFEDGLLAWCKLGERGPKRARDAKDYYEYLREHWKTDLFSRAKVSGDFEQNWYHLLQMGCVGSPAAVGGFGKAPQISGLAPRTATQGYELSLYLTSGLADGTLSNVSWLQEFPDPVTKICWDNYVCMSPADAKKENLKEGSVVKVTANGVTVEAPVHIQPGQADGVLGLAVGYGRKGMGKIADGVGVNAFPMAGFKNGMTVYAGIPATIAKAGRMIQLANTQGHHSMEGRDLVIEASLADFKKNPKSGIHDHHIQTMWSEHEYPGHKWGMVIDLNACNGCSACLVACQSENNIPVVGKKYVLLRREMHWIRIDRYYTGQPENPKAVFQPVTCQHCDNAPCETVCPVLATVHSDEGTNDMIYNRCVGTRYCSNNCPYKVRRFNWFNYVKTIEKPLNNQLNPDVTVRARGVMEKCTFCTHRIKAAKLKAKVEQRELKDGDVQVACQQGCPTNAITFGDLNDKTSAVAQLFHTDRSYALLGELNTKPALHYMTKIRNSDVSTASSHESHESKGHHS